MPKIQTYEIYTMPAAGATKTFVSTGLVDVYELNATGGAIVLAADMTFAYSGTPIVGSEFKFQYGGGVTQNLALGRSVSFFGTNLTDAQALLQMVVTAYWNGLGWEVTLLKSIDADLSSIGPFGSASNANALTVTSGVLNMEPANASFGGGVSTGTQTFAGEKTLNLPVINNIKLGYSTTFTTTGTTTLISTSNQQQYFTGATTQILVLPVVSTLALGIQFRVTNLSSGIVTINSSGGNLVKALDTNYYCLLTCILITGTSALSWSVAYIPIETITLGPIGSIPNINALKLSPTNVLNVEPASALWGGVVSTTTQTFSGNKTFNAPAGNLLIDSLGVGLGTVTNPRRFLQSVNTFTEPISGETIDIGLVSSTSYLYSGETSIDSRSVGAMIASSATGVNDPGSLWGVDLRTISSLSSTLAKSITCRLTFTSSFSSTTNINVTSNANALAYSVAGPSNTNLITTIANNYDFRAATPHLSVSGASSDKFFITNQYGFYCEDYSALIGGQLLTIPFIFNSSINRSTATITNAFQLYIQGEQKTNIGSYIGNRLGVAFATAPTANTDITALLHIGAGTTASAQIRLVLGVAPTNPNDGDIWFQPNILDPNAGLRIRINGIIRSIVTAAI